MTVPSYRIARQSIARQIAHDCTPAAAGNRPDLRLLHGRNAGGLHSQLHRILPSAGQFYSGPGYHRLARVGPTQCARDSFLSSDNSHWTWRRDRAGKTCINSDNGLPATALSVMCCQQQCLVLLASKPAFAGVRPAAADELVVVSREDELATSDAFQHTGLQQLDGSRAQFFRKPLFARDET